MTPDSATAQADGLEFSISTLGSLLRVLFTNRSDGTLVVYFFVEGPNARHHDFLTADLTSAGSRSRTLLFTGDRNGSTVGLTTLQAGESIGDDIDLAAWAVAPINGEAPLNPGEYALTATSRVHILAAWTGRLTAGPVRLLVG